MVSAAGLNGGSQPIVPVLPALFVSPRIPTSPLDMCQVYTLFLKLGRFCSPTILSTVHENSDIIWN
jgi:hypothetical protein